MKINFEVFENYVYSILNEKQLKKLGFNYDVISMFFFEYYQNKHSLFWNFKLLLKWYD